MQTRSRSRFRGRIQPISFLQRMADYGATDVWDFTTNTYIRGGSSAPSGLSVTRASSGYAQRNDGIWESFASGVLRRTDKGALVEASRTNRALHSRDLTQPAWSATNVTVTRNQVGVDGTANSACSLTATAGNGTVLQTTSDSSRARYFSIWIKRITGTGTVQVTLDNGSTWTGVTITSGWTRVGAAQTLSNPTAGVRIVTSGDAVAVDFAQLEDGAFPSSPIATAGTAVTRAADVVTADITGAAYPLSLVGEFLRAVDTGGIEKVVQVDAASTSNNNFNLNVTAADEGNLGARMGFVIQADITVTGALALNATQKIAGRLASNNAQVAVNGTLGTQDNTVGSLSNPTVFRFGQRAAEELFGYVRRAALINRAITDAELQGITT